jgi:hypothetical protein
MTHNVGPAEQLFRLVTAAAAGAIAATMPPGWLRTILGVVAVSELVTGLARYCPVNTAMGINNAAGGDEMMHFDRSRPWGRQMNRLQHRLPATSGYGTRTQRIGGRIRYPLAGRRS